MPNLLQDLAQAFRLLNGSSDSGHYEGVTTDAGLFTFPHALGTAPSKVQITPNGAGTSNPLGQPFVYQTTATSVTLSFFPLAGSAAGMAVAGSYTVMV